MKKLNDDQIKDRLFEILIFFDSFCKKNDLQYTLDAGTLLGAARHKDFIPWDDDIDVAMPFNDYKKLISLSKNIDPNGKFVMHGYSKKINNKENYIYPFLKLENSRTMAKISIAHDKGGAWIDIFPLNYVPDNQREFLKYVQKFNRLHDLIGIADAKKNENPLKASLRWVIRRGSNLYRNKMINLMYSLDTVKSSRVEDIVWATNREHDFFPAEILEEYTTLEFRGRKFKVVKDYDKYLTIEYGNWRKLPPKNERVSHHGYELFDLD